MKREVRISVAGQSLTIRSDEDEGYIKTLADYVSDRMREVGHGREGTTTVNLAILAALNIADEYHRRGRSRRASARPSADGLHRRPLRCW